MSVFSRIVTTIPSSAIARNNHHNVNVLLRNAVNSIAMTRSFATNANNNNRFSSSITFIASPSSAASFQRRGFHMTAIRFDRASTSCSSSDATVGSSPCTNSSCDIHNNTMDAKSFSTASTAATSSINNIASSVNDATAAATAAANSTTTVVLPAKKKPGKILAFVKEYGAVGVATYLSTYFGLMGMLYVAISQKLLFGFDPHSALHYFGMTEESLPASIREYLSVDGITAWLLTELTEPARIVATVALTPKIKRLISRAPPAEAAATENKDEQANTATAAPAATATATAPVDSSASSSSSSASR